MIGVIIFSIMAFVGFVMSAVPFSHGIPFWIGIVLLCVGCLGATIFAIKYGEKQD